MAKGSRTRNRAPAGNTARAAPTKPVNGAAEKADLGQTADISQARDPATSPTMLVNGGDQVTAPTTSPTGGTEAGQAAAQGTGGAADTSMTSGDQGDQNGADNGAGDRRQDDDGKADENANDDGKAKHRTRTFHVMRRHDGPDGTRYGTKRDAQRDDTLETTRKAVASDVDHLVRAGVLSTKEPADADLVPTSMVSGREA